MEESSTTTLKLIIEKGPRAGQTHEYPQSTVVRIGRVVRGNTIGIKDAGISTKHICIQFDHQSSKWTVSDLDSSNGTILNSENLKPYLPAALNDGDCIKIGELTSILVKFGVQSAIIQSERNPRRQAKSAAGGASSNSAVIIESERLGLGLGFEGGLGENAVEVPVEKRNLRSRAKKGVEVKKDVESVSSQRTLRSSRKEVKGSFVPRLGEILEDLSLVEVKAEDVIIPIQGKKTRGGRKRKVPVEVPPREDPDVVVVVVPEENSKTAVEESSDAAEQPKSTHVDKGKEVKAKDVIVPIEGKEAISEVANEAHVVDKGKEVAEEVVECRQSGGGVNNIGSIDSSSQWVDLEKMTLGDFFDCLMVQLPNEIRDKSEKILSDLKENARKCHEFRLQRNRNGEDIH